MMKTFIECPICDETLEEPVLLTCGHTICKSHEKDEEKSLEKITCPTCNSENIVSQHGFPSNLLVQNLINFNFNQLNLGAEHIVAVESFRDFKELVEELKRMRENPELEINRVVGNLKNKIDLRREKGKKKLDDEALGLISELDDYEAKCKADVNDSLEMSTETVEFIQSIEKFDIPIWKNDLKMFKRKVKRLETIHKDVSTKTEILRGVKEGMKKQLFGDELPKLEEKQKRFCLKNTDSLL